MLRSRALDACGQRLNSLYRTLAANCFNQPLRTLRHCISLFRFGLSIRLARSTFALSPWIRLALIACTLTFDNSLSPNRLSAILARSCEEDSPTERLAPSSWPLTDFGSLHNYRFSRFLACLVALNSRLAWLDQAVCTLSTFVSILLDKPASHFSSRIPHSTHPKACH